MSLGEKEKDWEAFRAKTWEIIRRNHLGGTVAFGWGLSALGLGIGAYRHRLGVCHQSWLELLLLIWMLTGAWATFRPQGKVDAVGLRGTIAKGADRIQAVVTAIERAIFRWVPDLTVWTWAVFLFLALWDIQSGMVAAHFDRLGIFFMIALVPTQTWMRRTRQWRL